MSQEGVPREDGRMARLGAGRTFVRRHMMMGPCSSSQNVESTQWKCMYRMLLSDTTASR